VLYLLLRTSWSYLPITQTLLPYLPQEVPLAMSGNETYRCSPSLLVDVRVNEFVFSVSVQVVPDE